MKIVNLKAVPSELPVLAKWHQQEWADLNPGKSLKDRINKMQAYLENGFVPSTYVAIADELLGSAAIVKCDMDTRAELEPWLASVYVAKSQRGNGIGTALVKHIMQKAAHNGIERLYLFTPGQKEFYQGLGWQYLEQTQYHDQQVTIMYVDLTS